MPQKLTSIDRIPTYVPKTQNNVFFSTSNPNIGFFKETKCLNFHKYLLENLNFFIKPKTRIPSLC